MTKGEKARESQKKERKSKREFNLVQVTRVKIKCLHLFVTSAKLVCELVDKLFKVFHLFRTVKLVCDGNEMVFVLKSFTLK